MKIWVDDIRTPPDDSWVWEKDSMSARLQLARCKQWGWDIEVMSLDHDLGGDDTSRPIVLWMCENDFWPDVVFIHTMNPIGRTWLEGMISRYHPTGATNPNKSENG